ncbi:hypothetical protein WJ25_00005 [Burkholderia thailandensis]|nr:hypothetical protein WJ25_00005 [Burkholderia thailandensis]
MLIEVERASGSIRAHSDFTLFAMLEAKCARKIFSELNAGSEDELGPKMLHLFTHEVEPAAFATKLTISGEIGQQGLMTMLFEPFWRGQ